MDDNVLMIRVVAALIGLALPVICARMAKKLIFASKGGGDPDRRLMPASRS